MYKILASILFLALITGCSAGPRWTWDHHRNTEAEMGKDLEDCRGKAARELANTYAGAVPLGFEYTDEKNDLVRQCMERKGYFYRDTQEGENLSGAGKAY